MTEFPTKGEIKSARETPGETIGRIIKLVLEKRTIHPHNYEEAFQVIVDEFPVIVQAAIDSEQLEPVLRMFSSMIAHQKVPAAELVADALRQFKKPEPPQK